MSVGARFLRDAMNKCGEIERKRCRLLLLALILLEGLLFLRYAREEIAWAYPRHYDQAHYLNIAYGIYDATLSSGSLAPLAQALVAPNPQTSLYPLLGSISCLLFGASRVSCLLVNFAHFAAVQLTCPLLFQRIVGRRSYGFLAIGLLLAATTFTMWAGDLYDFRIDSAAMCTYGITIAALLATDGLRKTGATLVAGTCALYLVMLRHLAVVYVLGIVGAIAVLILLKFATKRGAQQSDALRQFSNLSLFAAFPIAALAFVISTKWQAIRGYYVVGHIESNEKDIRAAAEGVNGVMGHFFFYPHSLMVSHLGMVFVSLAAFVILLSTLNFFLGRTRASTVAGKDFSRLEPCALLVIAIIVPLAALTADIAKSPVVANIVVVPVVLFIVTIFLCSDGAVNSDRRSKRWIPVGVALLVMICGLSSFVQRSWKYSMLSADREDTENVLRLFKAVDILYRQRQGSGLRVFSNTVYDALASVTMSAYLFEKHRHIYHFDMPIVIDELPKEKVLADLQESDVAFLSDPVIETAYPFTRAIAKYNEELLAWAKENLILVERRRVNGSEVSLFAKTGAGGQFGKVHE